MDVNKNQVLPCSEAELEFREKRKGKLVSYVLKDMQKHDYLQIYNIFKKLWINSIYEWIQFKKIRMLF